MSFTGAVAALRKWLAEREQARAVADFTCGHCARNSQCGREPSASCIEKHEQIAQGDGWRYRPGIGRHEIPYQ